VATYVIDNTGTLEDLRDRVTEVFKELVSTSSTEDGDSTENGGSTG
jgi:dephospho-CoA kinase